MEKSNIAAVFAAGALFGAGLTAGVGALAQNPGYGAEIVPYLRKVADAYAAVRQHFAGEADNQKMFDGCLSGLLRGADPHSDYLGAAEFREMQIGGTPRGALGMELASVPNGAQVVAALEGTPAERAGLQSGDILTRIDGAEMGGLGLAEIVRRLRGAPGSKVRLHVLRPGAIAAEELVVERQLITPRDVRARLLAGGIGYLRISQFAEGTPRALARQLLEMQKENGAPLRGVVLDLRSNPGGLLNSGIAVAAAFLRDDQLVLRMEGRTPESKKDYYATARDYVWRGEADFRRDLPAALREVPLAVLVNRGSAAAAELVAAALQDYQRATVVGEKTYGRGSIQTLMPMTGGGALKITTAYWHSPKGRALQGGGVEPDVLLDAAALAPVAASRLGADADAGVLRARELLERR